MIIIHTQTIPIQCVWDRHKKLIAPHPYETIELDELTNNMPDLKNIMIDVNLNEVSIYRIINNQVQLNGQVIPFEVDNDRAQLRDQYQAMITRLEQIQAATNPTNAQVIQAVKDEALYIQRLMKVLKNIAT